ncbi:MAG TPA: pyruvate dehydrogenase complex dihydrolipoamide acetyltransferase [Vicinamibacteria bacterium]|nr:pyruvate dehydrogenase complex dihydrolipoamide acetyltransferase [Vicinamibacteria bacterium]
MITRVVLAKLSPTMEEGTIVKWSKQEGDVVKVGDVLAEIETDKANMEMEALGAGVLRKLLVPAGGKAPVGALIGVIADAGEDIAPTLAEAAKAAAAAPAPAPPAPAPVASAAPASPAPTAAAAPRAPIAAAPPAPPPAAAASGRVKASPLARAIASRSNVPLAAVAGSGPGGRIVKRDVEGYIASPAPARSAPAAARPAAPVPTVVAGTALPLSSMRRTIAKRLSESAFTAPHFYVTVEIEMDAAVSLREQLLRAEEVKVSFNDLLVKACAKALTRFPTVNASWTGETIQTHAEVHIGVAVSVPDGLITPVVRNADQKHVVDIAAEIKDLAARARDKKLKPEEFMGSTFTISNLGMFDVTEFTAIINPPESCILAVGAVRKQPVVKNDQLAVGHRMKVTLSSDHRVVDGALAAQFLAEVRRLLENPASLLL